MESVIRMQRVTKLYGSHAALQDFSLEVPRGVVCALLGENGAGKTTAIRLMLGLTQADAGTVDVLGMDSWHDGQTVRSRVGYVAERPTLYEWMTVGEIGWFVSGFYPGKFLERYQSLIKGYQLPANRKLKALSKGMRAKVSLSLALAHEPELLILDEPTSGLDTLVRHEFLEGMVDIASTGRTVLLSSHQISEVERVADQVAIIAGGKLLLYEPLDDLKDQIRELSVTLADPNMSLPPIAGKILRSRRHQRQVQLLVRGVSEDSLLSLRANSAVEDLGLRTPSLEEIVVAYLQSGDAGPNAPAATQEVSR